MVWSRPECGRDFVAPPVPLNSSQGDKRHLFKWRAGRTAIAPVLKTGVLKGTWGFESLALRKIAVTAYEESVSRWSLGKSVQIVSTI